jgi:8-oxo-dGTP diphosphatase
MPSAPAYLVVPRTLCFILHGDDVLVLKRSPSKRLFPGKANGVGGHVEAGEDIYLSALREIAEETGLAVSDLWLAGVVHVDAALGQTAPLASGETPGVIIFVFTAQASQVVVRQSDEGELMWMPLDQVDGLDWVDGDPGLLRRALAARRTGEPFFMIRK